MAEERVFTGQDLRQSAVSGTYMSGSHAGNDSIAGVAGIVETIRLDVDGHYPQMMASGSYARSRYMKSSPTSWIAHPLRKVDSETWEGPIRNVWGDRNAIPHTSVRIHVPNQVLPYSVWMAVTFIDGAPTVTRTLKYVSPWFREVAFEFDVVEGSPQVTSVDTCAHNDHPVGLRCERLTFDKVYDRAGVDVSRSRRTSTVPLSLAGEDQAWSDAELQGAIRAYWSIYGDAPDWAVWVLFAGWGREETLAGSMFDDSDENQRQGVGIFSNAIDKHNPPYFPQRPEHVRRENFYALVHETGHCFNLHHPNNRGIQLYYNADLAWPLEGTSKDSATFMNYPDSNYYGKFYYTFDDSDLKFLRHAPDRFVQMGNYRYRSGEDEFGRKGYRSLPPWTLDIQLSRPSGVFEFLEPVTLTVTLTNSSMDPQIVDEAILEDSHNLSFLIRNPCGSSQLWRPFGVHCFRPTPRVLQHGDSIRAHFFIGAGLDGWLLAEPGVYTVSAMLSSSQLTVSAAPERVRIAHPRGWEEEMLAQDVFTKDVGRAFAFGASHGITAPVETLRRVMDELPDHAVSRHAALALAELVRSPTRILCAHEEHRGFRVVDADSEEARKLYNYALRDEEGDRQSCFGQVRYEDLSRQYRQWLQENGESAG